MRRLTAIFASLGLLLALLVAPFQHVHVGVDDHHEQHEGHGHSSIVHAHFLLVFIPVGENQRTEVTDLHQHKAISIDKFATTISATLALISVPQSRVLLFALPWRFSPVSLVELRGHDPPLLAFSAPRAPPA